MKRKAKSQKDSASKISEADLAAVVVKHFEDLGHEVFQEVELPGGVADIVVRNNAEIWVIETKKTWSLDLLSQCLDRKPYTHRVFAAVPYSKNFRQNNHIASKLGISSIQINMYKDRYYEGVKLSLDFNEYVNKKPIPWLAEKLSDGHKTHAKAGTNTGGRWTPFKATCEALAAAVSADPGRTIKENVEKISHHYASKASAINSLSHWISKGKVPGIKIVIADGDKLLWPAELVK